MHKGRSRFGRGALTAGAAAMAMFGAGAVSAPAVTAALSHVVQMQPNHVIGRSAPVGRGTSASAATSSPCWSSSNWSGYALSETTPSGLSCVPASDTAYTSVSATWTVPTVTGSTGRGGRRGSSSAAYSAVWTGIDGFANSDLIQAGTEQNTSGGSASYAAWWEILPAAETEVFSVDPGDHISVTISHTSTNGCAASTPWLISLTDTRGTVTENKYSGCHSYSGPGTSAEWIVEAPEVNGRIATLADYGTATLGVPSALTVNGADTNLVAGNSGEMVQNTVVSVPSSATNGDAFSSAYGPTAPSPPA